MVDDPVLYLYVTAQMMTDLTADWEACLCCLINGMGFLIFKQGYSRLSPTATLTTSKNTSYMTYLIKSIKLIHQ